MKHSPEPWQFDGYRFVRAADGDEVATVVVGADGPLVAAAPELAASLRQVTDFLATLADDLDIDAAEPASMIMRARFLLARIDSET